MLCQNHCPYKRRGNFLLTLSYSKPIIHKSPTIDNKIAKDYDISKLSDEEYSEIFTKEELQSVDNFYRTPGGQAYLKKLPLITSNIIKNMQWNWIKSDRMCFNIIIL